MADSALDIVNAALVRVGEDPITQTQLDTPPSTKVSAVVAELEYAPTRDEELRLHAWAFALVRATLLSYTTPAATLTPAATTGTGINFTASAAVFASTDVGKTLENQAGDGIALITAFTSTTVVVATITEAFPSTSAIAAGSWRLYYAAPAFNFTRAIARPSGMLRLLRVRHQVPYRAEGQYFATDAESLDAVYIARITDTTLFSVDFDEVLKCRLALKFANSIPGKQSYVESLAQLYAAALARAKEANAYEWGEGEWEENAADDTQSTIIQDAVARLVAMPQVAGLDPVDLTNQGNRLYPNARDELQRMHPWRFTRVRTVLDATTTVTLTPGAGATTEDTTGVTFTAGGAFFAATDVGARLMGTAAGIARITGFTSTTVVTATIESAFSSLSAIAAGSWHIAPPWKWIYRYSKPTGFLRLLETQCLDYFGGEPITWEWRYGWRWPGIDQPTEEPAVLEGIYLVSDAGPTLAIEYVKQVTDPALFEPGFASVLSALLAWRLALPLTKQPQIAQMMAQAFAAQLKAVRTSDKLDTRVPPKRANPLVSVRY